MTDWSLPHTYRSPIGHVRWNRLGDRDRRPLVLLHGTPFSSLIWRDVATALAYRYQVFVWDLPGYGTSDKYPDQDLSLDALAAVFAELLDRWGLDDPLVVAHDSGGAAALGAHLRHGAPYRRLALVDAVALGPWGSPFSELAGTHPDVFARLPAPLHAALLREYIRSSSGPGLRAELAEALAEPWSTDDGRRAFYRQLSHRLRDGAFTDSLRDRYPEVAPPVLICWGHDDAWIPLDRGRELARRIPDARLCVVADAGHLLPCDQPAQLTAALLDFLR